MPDPWDVPEEVPYLFSAAFYGSCPGCGFIICEGDPIAMVEGKAHCEECAFGRRKNDGKFDGTTSEEMGF